MATAISRERGISNIFEKQFPRVSVLVSELSDSKMVAARQLSSNTRLALQWGYNSLAQDGLQGIKHIRDRQVIIFMFDLIHRYARQNPVQTVEELRTLSREHILEQVNVNGQNYNPNTSENILSTAIDKVFGSNWVPVRSEEELWKGAIGMYEKLFSANSQGKRPMPRQRFAALNNSDTSIALSRAPRSVVRFLSDAVEARAYGIFGLYKNPRRSRNA